MENYMVTKLSSGEVFYRIPGNLQLRTWAGDGAKQLIPYSELEQCIYDPAIRTLFDGGYLYIDSQEARIKLGLEQADPSEYVNEEKIVMNKRDLVNLLYNEELGSFKEKVNKLAQETSQLLIEVAISTAKHAGYEKYDFLREKYGVDVEKLQRDKRDEKTSKEG